MEVLADSKIRERGIYTCTSVLYDSKDMELFMYVTKQPVGL